MSQYQSKVDAPDSNGILINEHFSDIRNLLEKKSTTFWHIKHLERYTKKGINPFGSWNGSKI